MNNKIKIQIENLTFLMSTHDNETLSNQLKHRGYHCYNNIHILKKYLKEDSYFLDLGANIGWYSILASLVMKKNGKVYAFEPDKKNVSILKENLKLNNIENVFIDEHIISDVSEKQKFYFNPENFGDHSISEKTFLRCFNVDEKNIAYEEIESIKLDDFFDEDDFSKVDLIKMDIQGSEPKALKGMSELLKNHRPTILLEYSPAHIYDVGSSPFEIFAFIENYRYIPCKIVENGKNPCQLLPYNIVDMFNDTFNLKQTYTAVDLLLVSADHS